MKIILTFLLILLSLNAEKVLVLNSNNDIVKYKETVDSFSKEFKKSFKIMDISKQKENAIKEYLYTEYPDTIYTVGAKAYQYAYEYLPEKNIFFSTIVNWKRLKRNDKNYGISNELHSSMNLTLIKSIFTNVKQIGIIYSKYTKNIIEDFQKNAQSLNIKIIPYKIEQNTVEKESFQTLINNVDAILIIPDPVLLAKQNMVKKLFANSKSKNTSIFAYHPLFLSYGAVLTISIDHPTTGRQIAAMISNKTYNKNIQYPAGTQVIFNKKVAIEQNIQFNPNITSLVNEVRE